MIDPSLFKYDVHQPFDVQPAAPPAEHAGGVTVHDTSFAAGAGRVAAYLVEPPPSAEPPYAGVLWVHWFEPEARSSNRTQFLEEAVALARHGVVSLLPDGFWSTTPARWAENPRYGWKTEVEHDRALCARQVIELRRALDLLAARSDIDEKRLAFVGHDFGAMYGAMAAGLESRLKGCVLMAGTFTFGDWFLFGKKLDDAAQRAYIEAMDPLAPVHFVKQAAPARLLFQFAHADVYVPERSASIFYEAASEPKEILWYEAAHDLDDMRKDSRRDRTRWLRALLGLPPADEAQT